MMQFKICLFCKRSLEQFCYSIYDADNQPYLNIMQLFGDVEDVLRHGRYICHECLYIIKWIYFMKKILSDALLDEDIGEHDKVIPAFNIFKLKMNQPIYMLADDTYSDDDEETLPLNGITDSETECKSPRNLPCFSEGRELTQKPIFTKPHNAHCNDPDVGGHSNCSNNNNSSGAITGNENGLMQYPCAINVCKHSCDTFEALMKHYQVHHLNKQHDLTIDNYAIKLQEFKTANSSFTYSQRKRFRCLLTQCRQVHKSIESLSEHKVKEHELLAKFWCKECYNLPFVTREDLNQHQTICHMNNKTIQRTNEYSCKYCDKIFLDKNLLSTHQLKHHPSQQSNTIIMKRLSIDDSKGCDSNTSANKRLCSFKMRRQKDILSKRKGVFHMNWLGAKYPHLKCKEWLNKLPPVNKEEKILISLPPRKRRQYQVVNEVENVNNVLNTMVTPVVEIIAVNAIASKESADMPKILSKLNTDESKIKVIDSQLNGAVCLPQEVTAKCNYNKGICNEKCIKLPSEDAKNSDDKATNVADKIIPVESSIKVNPSNNLQSVVLENAPKINEIAPLKTYNCRKRKLCQKPTKENSIKKAKEGSENKTEIIPDLVPLVQPILPPVISKIEEKDNDNNSGRITMTISLKAIKQYANDKEVKRESKRKKKSKGKKKCKQLSSSQDNTSSAEVEQFSSTVQSSNIDKISSVSSETKQLNEVQVAVVTEVNDRKFMIEDEAELVPITQIDDIVAQEVSVEYSNASRDISESENEARNEINSHELNKDEINMIIFGDTLCSNVANDVINEQVCNGMDEDSNIPVNMLEESIICEEVTLPVPAKTAKNKGKLKSRVGKKRKVKRKPDKMLKLTLDVDGEVMDEKQLHPTSGIEETVEGQISNVRLKDHLYARSAFNAFKQSK